MVFGNFQHPSPSGDSPLFSLFRRGVKSMVIMAIILIALGILTIRFPMILAMAVASLFFAIAFILLTTAWKYTMAARKMKKNMGSRTEKKYVEVEIIDCE